MGSNRFMDGLLWGMLLGGAGVFLFGTKKGKKLLDILSEEGAGGIHKVLREIENEIEDSGTEFDPDVAESREEVKDLITQKFEKIPQMNNSHKPKAKRFFSSSKKSL